jgi:hypothetical protein
MLATAWFLVAFGLIGGDSMEFVGPTAERAAQIVKRPTIHTATDWEPVNADVGLFEWLIDHPAATATMWKDLGVKIGSVELLPDGWRSRDPDGVLMEFHRVHQSAGLRAYYCKATAPAGTIRRSVTVEFVIIHRLGTTSTSDMTQPVDRLEAWVSAEGAALRFIMKLANDAATNAVLRSLRETKLYFAMAAKIAERRPQWAQSALVKQPAVISQDEFAQFEERLKRAVAARPIAARSTTSDSTSLTPTASTASR